MTKLWFHDFEINNNKGADLSGTSDKSHNNVLSNFLSHSHISSISLNNNKTWPLLYKMNIYRLFAY